MCIYEKHPVPHPRAPRSSDNRVDIRESKAPASRWDHRQKIKKALSSASLSLSLFLARRKGEIAERHDTTYAQEKRASKRTGRRTDGRTDARARARRSLERTSDLPIFKLDIFLHKELLGSYVVTQLVFPHPEPQPSTAGAYLRAGGGSCVSVSPYFSFFISPLSPRFLSLSVSLSLFLFLVLANGSGESGKERAMSAASHPFSIVAVVSSRRSPGPKRVSTRSER